MLNRLDNVVRNVRFGALKPFKVAVYLGSFNPIHNGHLRLAEQARDQFGMDAVEIVALARPVHKQAEFMSDDVRHYLNELAVKNRPRLFASRLDIDSPSPTLVDFEGKYPAGTAKTKLVLQRTLNLLDAVKAKYQKLTNRAVELSYIVGIDGLAAYPHAWKEPEYTKLVENCKFLIAARPGEGSIRNVVKELKKVQPGFRHGVLNLKPSSLSSTQIRKLLEAGKNITRHLTPKAVAAYLNEARGRLFTPKAA